MWLRAQNTSLTTELEEIRADLDAFIVENEQLAELVCPPPPLEGVDEDVTERKCVHGHSQNLIAHALSAE